MNREHLERILVPVGASAAILAAEAAPIAAAMHHREPTLHIN